MRQVSHLKRAYDQGQGHARHSASALAGLKQGRMASRPFRLLYDIRLFGVDAAHVMI